jgi:saccharopine dehydrogenase-like NADP-dependent oxidoreductase
MRSVCVLGAGTIGSLIAGLLSRTGDYAVHLGDHNESSKTPFPKPFRPRC